MKSLANIPLQKRISLLVLAGLVISLGLFSWLGIQSLQENTRRILDERLTIARVMASHLDHTLEYILKQLQATDFNDGLPAEEQFVPAVSSLRETLSTSGIFARNVLLINKDGKILQVEPADSGIIGTDMSLYSELKQTLDTGLPTISNLVVSPPAEVPVIFATVPILNERGKVIGALTCSIDIEQSSNDALLCRLSLRNMYENVQLGPYLSQQSVSTV